jgi:competence protein ComEA
LRKIKKLFIWIAVACVAATVYAITVNLGGPITVDVAGAVVAPSIYELERGSRVYEAIDAAGGFTKDADADADDLNLAAVLYDGDKLYVPAKEAGESGASPSDTEETPPDSAESGESEVSPPDTEGAPSEAEAPPPDSTESIGVSPDASGSSDVSDARPVNINTADAETLQTLKGIGPVTAKKIIDYRSKKGPFKKIEDIKKVDGIGEKTFEKLKKYIRVK